MLTATHAPWPDSSSSKAKAKACLRSGGTRSPRATSLPIYQANRARARCEQQRLISRTYYQPARNAQCDINFMHVTCTHHAHATPIPLHTPRHIKPCHPHAMLTQCTRHAQALQTPRARHAHAMRTPCARHAHAMHAPVQGEVAVERAVAVTTMRRLDDRNVAGGAVACTVGDRLVVIRVTSRVAISCAAPDLHPTYT